VRPLAAVGYVVAGIAVVLATATALRVGGDPALVAEAAVLVTALLTPPAFVAVQWHRATNRWVRAVHRADYWEQRAREAEAART